MKPASFNRRPAVLARQAAIVVAVLATLVVGLVPAPVLAQAEAAKPVLPDRARKPAGMPAEVPLSAEQVMYQYLLSEIAVQRGNASLATQGMLDLAFRSRDARVARRATEIAFQARQMNEARTVLVLWLSIEPESSIGRQALAVLIGTQGGLDKSNEAVRAWLADKAAQPVMFTQLPFLYARFPDRMAVAASVATLAESFATLPEAQFAVAMTAFAAGDAGRAERAIERALSIRPDYGRAAIVKAQFLRASETAGSTAEPGKNAGTGADTKQAAPASTVFLADFLRANPAAAEVRMVYARMLVGEKAFLSAREEFKRVAKDRPDDAEPMYATGLISLQMEDFATADAALKKTLELKPRDRNPVYFNLGLVAEGQGDVERAQNWYRQIADGELFVGAQVKMATLINKRDGLEAARKFLREAQANVPEEVADGELRSPLQVSADTPDTRTQLILAEVQMLRDASLFRDAYQLLTEAVMQQPTSVALRYDRAMVAEKLDRLDDMEADLRIVISAKPDHAHAFNALGYTFAERGVRLEEAEQLIGRAVVLAPEDAFILDSLGWVQFKRGDKMRALETLERAYRMRRDPEIAAHVGEVLWAVGRRDDALRFWQTALTEFPGHPTLTTAIERSRK